MFLLVGGVIMLVVSNVLGLSEHNREKPARLRYGGGIAVYGKENVRQNVATQLPHYKDVFLAGLSGKPTLGSSGSTCWARGGICVNINQCPSLNMDVGIAGCSRGYKVCCRIHRLTSPTVGVLRRYSVPVIYNLDDLGSPLEIIALRNSMLLSSWQTKKPESDEINLEDLLKQ